MFALYSKLWDYQKPAADFTLDREATALFLEQGTGKTFLTAGIIDKLIDDSFCGLLVVPAITIAQPNGWLHVLRKLNVKVCRSRAKFKSTRGAKILLLSYEAFCPKRTKNNPRGSQTFVKWLVNFHWSLVVFDEAQKLTARGSRQSRTAGRIKNAERRIILTGTPWDSPEAKPDEIWAQWRFLDPSLFGTRWAKFDRRYLRPTGWKGYKRKFKPGAQAKVIAKIDPYCVRITNEVLGLEPPKFIKCPVNMGAYSRDIYDRMEQDFVTKVGKGSTTAELRIVRDLRLQQICGGFIKLDDGREVMVGHAKLRRLKRLLEKVPHPVVIFCRYLWEVDQIARRCSSANCRVATITGDTRDTRMKTLRLFKKGKIDVLVSQIRTGGVGINLQRAHIGIFYSTTYSHRDFYQAIYRLLRAGQKNKVKIYLLLAKDSVDEEIFHAVRYKYSTTELILRRFKRKRLERRLSHG